MGTQILPCACLLLVAWASAGCSNSDQHALNAAGISMADMEVFRRPEARASVCLGDRSLAVLTYPPVLLGEVQGSRSRVPHFVVAGAPSVWGFGPVTVWEGSRVLLWSKRDAWWVLTDLGGKRGAVLLLAYDNFSVGGPIELHLYQEPQTDKDSMKWWFFVWMPFDLSRDGFILRPVPDSKTVQLSIEAMREGKIVTIGDIRIDQASEAVKLHMREEASEQTSSEPSGRP